MIKILLMMKLVIPLVLSKTVDEENSNVLNVVLLQYTRYQVQDKDNEWYSLARCILDYILENRQIVLS